MSRLDPSARVRNHISEVVAQGPLEFEALVAALVDQGLALGPDPEERVDAVLEEMNGIDFVAVGSLDDPASVRDLVYDRFALLSGTTWTVPLGELDLASNTLSSLALGLAFIALVNGWGYLEGADHLALDYDRQRHETAAELGVNVDDSIAVVLPEGWLAGLGARAGGYLQLQFDGEAILARAADDAPQPTEELTRALQDAFASGNVGDNSRGTAEVLTQLLLIRDELRSTAFPALVDWCEAAGLTRRGPMIAPVGFDFEREELDDQIEDAIESYGMKGRDAKAFEQLALTWHSWRSNPQTSPNPQNPQTPPSADSLASAAAALDSIPVATAFVESFFDPDLADELVSFGEHLIDATSGRHRAGPAWLIAEVLGNMGHTERFEAWIDTALSFDVEHLLSLYDKASFEFDRSEFRKAKTLLNRLGMPADSHDMALIDSVLTASGPEVGRNDPCPCGSGRKYKRCHLGVDEIPLNARLTILYRKANRWLGERYRTQVHTAALIRAGNSGISPADLLDRDPLVPDVVLTEGGRFAQWLDERGALLPSDEALLAAQWALVERSVYQVTEVRLDQGLTLRDVRTGDVVDVQERRGTHGMKTGTYILARPLPVGDDTLQIFGGVTLVSDEMLQSYIDLLDDEPEVLSLLSLVARAEGPPELRNTDGENLVFSDTTWQVADPLAARRVLDDNLHPEPGAATEPAAEQATLRWSWLADPRASATADDSPDVVDDGRTVLGNVALAGDRLTIKTNSLGRAQQAIELIAQLLPDAVLVEELTSSLDDIQEDLAYERYIYGDEAPDDGTAGGGAPGAMIDPTQAPPEIQAALRQQMDRYEEQWVDEPIPALGGATPREALDDPTRRDDLFRLLDRMEEMDSRLPANQAGLGMRTSRLRELLGL